MRDPLPRWTDREIVAARPPKQALDPRRPYAFWVEPEHTATGRVDAVATIFLTNRECRFRCLMCDLWKNTTDIRVPAVAIPEQIDFALSHLPSARHVKLYNNGNFFDRQAVPPEDYAAIAGQVRGFSSVIVENHPGFCGPVCLRFRDLLGTDLEIAIGLETVHAEILDRLNKRMMLDDYQRAVGFLRRHDIGVRTFILLRPPFMNEQEGIEWALRSIDHAFSVWAQCCSVIPTRAGNGIMNQLQMSGAFAPPRLASMETVLEAGLRMGRGRVLMDLWDVEQSNDCPRCGPLRAERLRCMNLSQQVVPAVTCACETAP